MKHTGSQDLNDQVIKVLKYWHLIEFFNPFDLDDAISHFNSEYFEISPGKLQDQALPWLFVPPDNANKKYNYYLYLLPFNKNELTRLSATCFPLGNNAINQVEFEERLENEGETCFAKLTVNSAGIPDLDTLSISTLPWALGRLQQNKLTQLNANTYAIAQKKLQIELSTLAERIKKLQPSVLNAMALADLLKILINWAGFAPTHPLALIIEQQETKSVTAGAAKSVSDIDTDALPILNSFYIEDLEKVINHFVSQKEHSAIISYINGVESTTKIDLYLPKNNSFIIDKLQPKYLNRGRWPHDPKHKMSLMQQFAINECFYPTTTAGIFSVNGPPGTGKTTLLQDIIAENIVQRATILAEFNSVADTFSGKTTAVFNNGNKFDIGILNPRLTGYEMLVASTNNAAVENISKDLPLRCKLGKEYQECGYLKAVAAKVLVDNNPNADQAWGLIAAALGNSTNRSQFVNSVMYGKKENKEDKERRIKDGKYLTIWEWSRKPSTLSFATAKKDFHRVAGALKDYSEKINNLTQLHAQLLAMNFPKWFDEQNIQLTNLTKEQAKLQQLVKSLGEKTTIAKQEKDQAYQEILQAKQLRPNIFARIFRTALGRSYLQHLRVLQSIWKVPAKKHAALQQQLLAAKAMQIRNDAQIAALATSRKLTQAKYDLLQQHQLQLRSELDAITITPEDNILTDAMEEHGFWQNDTLNNLRTELFIAALQLHEAWLVEAIRTNYFRENMLAISNLLSRSVVVTKNIELFLWQSLFMWVPVISSTFASISRQFKNIGPQAFGWLLIDEAGQAVPQAAIGAMWRARKIVVMGDPLQIEPVFTIPINLINGLASAYFSAAYEQWLPFHTSIQVLADNANILGAEITIADQVQWIGSPLRLHRRCLDPMFTIANDIAYDNKMINARKINDAKYLLGESAWFDIVGGATDKQYVTVQGELLLQLFLKLYNEHRALSEFYIITPFKKIKANLKQLLMNTKLWKSQLLPGVQLPSFKSLKIWCDKHIGTVHTFQGKEAKIVILVLGADRNTQGAVNWAAQKPNLLNVAVTRAKDRIYVIGDFDLWASRRFFNVVARVLPRKPKLL